MESDDRFKHLASDPRFRNLRKKQKKIVVDERFQSMFTDEKFTLKYSKDKRGMRQKKTSGDDLKKYYSLADNVEGSSSKDPERKFQKTRSEEQIDADDTDPEASSHPDIPETNAVTESEDEDEEIDDEESQSEVSSSSDESESGVDDPQTSEDEDDSNKTQKIEYDWRPLDHDAVTAESTSKRLAIQNLDWDHLDVKDIYALVNSIVPPLSVKIFVSEFGKQRLEREEREGPQEIVEMTHVDEEEEEYNQLRDKMRVLKNKELQRQHVNEYEDADEELDPRNEEIRERIRRYQLNRMKYYYAVVEFDSVESAEKVYRELDGVEYEGSSLELDLRFIPDDIEFDQADLKAECNKLPDLTSYKAPQFINTALQQTTVKFTWDETDVKRQDKLRKAFTKEELEKDDLEAYLATESDTDEEEDEVDIQDGVSVVTANSEVRANKYKMLLKSLDEEEEKKKKVDVDIEWGDYSDDEERADLAKQDASSNLSDSDSSIGTSSPVERTNKATRNVKAKEKRDSKKKKKRKNKKKPDEGSDGDEHDEELDLLVMDAKESREDFKFDPDDERFKAVYESGLYNVDPSHPNFKRTTTFDLIAERKRQKRQKKNI